MMPEQKRPPTLEDLLRLKRAERPPAEFWSDFDRELRAKQLAALVQRHPWWQTLPAAALDAVLRFRLPLGAAAALAITFYSFRGDQPTVAAPGATVSPQPVAAAPAPAAPEPLAVATVVAAEPALVAVSLPALTAGEGAADKPATAESPVKSRAPSAAETVALSFPAVSGTHTLDTDFSGSPLLAVSLAPAGSSGGPVVTHLLGGASGFESRALPARTTVEPLQQMSSPGETRRARLLTAMVSMASMDPSARTTERAASRIAEDDLYDQVQRFGARGDRLHVKF
jgi:hypothetical protein